MFNPVRLQTARERRELTKKALAERAGVSQLTLTRLENGTTSEPERSTVSSLAQALGFPVEFFYLDDCEQILPEAVNFRSLSATTARQRKSALASGTIALQLNDWVDGRFNLPAPDLLDLRGEAPETAAAALRSHWGIGDQPIGHLLQIVESKGVRIFYLAENNKNVDAFSFWRNGTPLIFLNTFKSAERSRFDTAHELGHLVLHVHGACVGREVENEADRFAAAFLMPREDLISNIRARPQVRDLLAAKSRWGVSLVALARNCYEAGLMTEWHYREVCKALSIAGYRTKEPNPMPRESSVLWKKILESLWQDRVTKDHVARALALPMDTINSLIDAGESGGTTMERGRTALRVV